MRKQRQVIVEDEESGFGAYLFVDASDKDISFGGTRIDASVTRGMVEELADNMSLKLAGHGSPLGGAKAGLRISPNDPNLKQHLARFAEECRELLTSTTIIGKDMGAQSWMLDEIYQTLDMPQLGIAQRLHDSSRCPDRLFELDGYIKNMTGLGVFWAIEQALGGEVRGARVIIQGFGVVGAGVAWHLGGAGARVVGVSDRDNAVVDPEGIELTGLLAARDNGLLRVDRLPQGCSVIPRDELLAQPADVLVLAAGSYLVDAKLAAGIQAPVIVEGANMALLPDAIESLHGRGVRVVPDIVANSSSAALVCHQIASGNTRTPETLWEEIEHNIKSNTDAVERISKQLGINTKQAFRRVIATEET